MKRKARSTTIDLGQEWDRRTKELFRNLITAPPQEVHCALCGEMIGFRPDRSICKGCTYRETLKLKGERHRMKKHNLPDTLTDEDWFQCLAYWRYLCAVCEGRGLLTIDHWISITSRDCPGHVPSNIVVLCDSCNSSKRQSPTGKMAHPETGRKGGPQKVAGSQALLRMDTRTGTLKPINSRPGIPGFFMRRWRG